MVTPPNNFEVLRVIHHLWIIGQLEAAQVKSILDKGYGLDLTVLSLGEIKTQTKDEKTKYYIKL